MTLIVQELTDNDTFEEIGRVEDGEVTDTELYDIFPETVWHEQDEDWIAARLDGPRVVAGMVDDAGGDAATKQATGEWVPYRGPRGGEGWQRVDDPNEVRYQTDPPGDVAEGYDSDHWAGDDADADADPGDAVGDEIPETVAGDEVIDYPVVGANADMAVPRVASRDDFEAVLRDMDLYDEVTYRMRVEGTFSSDDPTDIARATSHVLGDYTHLVDEFNHHLIDRVESHVDPDFETPVGLTGVEVHDLLEETFGSHSEIVLDLEERVLHNDEVDERDADAWLSAAEDWIRDHGNRGMATQIENGLEDVDRFNPFSTTPAPNVPDDMNPAHAEQITPLSDTDAETGISAESMFIADMPDGDRAFVTNVSADRSTDYDDVGMEGKTEAQRAMLGYKCFEAADWPVPRHEYVENEYWTVAEADGTPAKEWDGDPDEIDRDEFARLAAIGMLSGNWDLHGGNVFVQADGTLVPVDLDLSGHDMQESRNNSTAWGRFRRLADSLGLWGDGPDSRDDGYTDKAEMKADVKEAVAEVVDDGTARAIKRVASNTDNLLLQMNVEENVFAAQSGRLIDA